jgi:tetratricopeptide (TPR) repeat protein
MVSSRETEPLGWRKRQTRPQHRSSPSICSHFQAVSYTLGVTSSADRDSTFTFYRRGIELLAERDYEHATEQLEQAARQAPEKASVREALGRAYFSCGRFAAAAEEFAAVVEAHQVNDFAHFCLGRALSKTGETERARHHLALASNLRPERGDYRFYRDQLRQAG